MILHSGCPCCGKEYSYCTKVSRDWWVFGYPPFSYLWSFPTIFQGRKIVSSSIFLCIPSLIAMEIDSLVRFGYVFKGCICMLFATQSFSSETEGQRRTICGELEQNGIGY